MKMEIIHLDIFFGGSYWGSFHNFPAKSPQAYSALWEILFCGIKINKPCKIELRRQADNSTQDTQDVHTQL